MADALTPEQVSAFQGDGYVLVEQHFTAEEMATLLEVACIDQELAAIAADRKDAEGRVSRLSLRFDLPVDAYGAYARHHRIILPLQQLLGCEVYHYHHKMMMKEPLTGGAWEWHQDFGYWHENFLYPDMASCMIAVDRATRANGCLQVLRGSHRMGRLDHGRTGDQTGTEADRIAEVGKRLELVHCEMEPGTVLFFHSNLLHRSDANTSSHPRWALICCYTGTHNLPFRHGALGGPFEPCALFDDDRVAAELADHHRHLTAAAG
ncbi:MAG: phytanoyl-CoA dioxygenase family protein [Candidatus Latescibacterota bacterium]|nr:phytanoyl-CoA dioxygenase family protein [Candidatus Latescibacterota bacterium]